MTCTISAYWNYGLMMQAPSENLDGFTQTAHMSQMGRKGIRSIAIDPDGVNQVLDAEYYSYLVGDWFLHVPLAATFALAISEFQDASKNWETIRSQDSTRETMIITDLQYSYGYSTSSNSVRLSMSVIATYCVVTILYLAYILKTGTTSTAWNSAVELVALALQSKTPENFGNTSVGIDCLETFNQNVGIRVNAEDKLELVFANDSDFAARGLRKIERNKAY